MAPVVAAFTSPLTTLKGPTAEEIAAQAAADKATADEAAAAKATADAAAKEAADAKAATDAADKKAYDDAATLVDDVRTEGQDAALAGVAGDDKRALAVEREDAEPIDYTDLGYQKTGETPGVATAEQFNTPSTKVADTLANIMSKGSALSAVTQSNSREQASALGMMSSSAGIGAGQRALIGSALPIAKQDAETAKEFNQAQQETHNKQTVIETEAQVSGDMLVQKSKIFDAQKADQDKWALLVGGADADLNERASYVAEGINQRTAEFQNDLNMLLNQIPFDKQAETEMGNSIAEAGHDISTQFASILSNPEALDNFVIYKADGTTVDKVASDKAFDAAMNSIIKPWKATLIFKAKSLGIYDDDTQAEVDAFASQAYKERGVQI